MQKIKNQFSTRHAGRNILKLNQFKAQNSLKIQGFIEKPSMG